MKGEFNWGGHAYRWWAGESNPDASVGYCVHVWRDNVGVTKYVDYELSQQEAESTAEVIAPHVEALVARGI